MNSTKITTKRSHKVLKPTKMKYALYLFLLIQSYSQGMISN